MSVEPQPNGRSGSRALSAVLDQGLSSVSNVLAVLVVARQLDAAAFGSFSVAYTALALFLGVSRAFFGLPLSLTAKDGPSATTSFFHGAWAALLVLSLPVFVVVAGVAYLLVQPATPGAVLAIVFVGLATPLIVLQDLGRYYALAIGRPQVALLSDIVWLIGIVALFAVPALAPGAILGLWLSIIIASLAVIVVVFRPAPRWSETRGHLRLRRGLRESVTGTVLLSSGTSLAVNGMATRSYGLELVGGMRGASTAFGPVNTLITFLDFAVLPRLAGRPARESGRLLWSAMAACLFCSACWITVLLLLPDAWGTWLLGDTWERTRSILPITAIEYVLLTVAAVLSLALKARGAARALFVSKIISSSAIVVGVVVVIAVGAPPLSVPAVLVMGALTACAALALALLLARRKDKNHDRS